MLQEQEAGGGMSEIDDDEKRICCICVGETYLAQQIGNDGQPGTCSYCGDTLACITIEELADRVETAFNDHFVRTATYPDSWQERAMADRESDYVWEREGQPVVEAIEEAACIPSDAASDVQEILDNRHGDFDSAAMGEETEFSGDAHYEGKGASARAWHDEWDGFERSLKTEARFFSRTAAELLARVFGQIDTLKTKPRRPLVVDAGRGRKINRLYRARVFQSDEKLEEALCRPDIHLGSPPARSASAGRMNARGISVFYGATNAGVALAEVRPPVGSKVAVAKFEIIRRLRLLDLTALDDVKDGGSIFDPTLRQRLERVAFLRTLGERMTRPVMPDDEAFDYLATQAVADFLATENEPRLDGIIFGSAQVKTGRNVVLLHKAARVEELRLPDGSKITAHTGHDTEDGWEIDYYVSEEVPKPESAEQPKPEYDLLRFMTRPGEAYRPDEDYREASLRVDASSVNVHHIAWVKVNSTPFGVTRHRREAWNRKF
jgi:hypothetical protein